MTSRQDCGMRHGPREAPKGSARLRHCAHGTGSGKHRGASKLRRQVVCRAQHALPQAPRCTTPTATAHTSTHTHTHAHKLAHTIAHTYTHACSHQRAALRHAPPEDLGGARCDDGGDGDVQGAAVQGLDAQVRPAQRVSQADVLRGWGLGWWGGVGGWVSGGAPTGRRGMLVDKANKSSNNRMCGRSRSSSTPSSAETCPRTARHPLARHTPQGPLRPLPPLPLS
jgi:hypothetical protein